MKIDLEALRKISEGDPETKITVKRKWLKAVYAELVKQGTNDRLADMIDKLTTGKRK